MPAALLDHTRPAWSGTATPGQSDPLVTATGHVPLPLAFTGKAVGAQTPSASPKLSPADIPRRPSPWHEIAHSLSTTSLPPRARRSSSTASLSAAASLSVSISGSSVPPSTPPEDDLSTSQALREWDLRLAQSDPSVQRHELLSRRSTGRALGAVPVPKLEAERDKTGCIEYKLKLIDPTPERFERLVTQMMWRLQQGRNEAIYELGLADDGTVVGLPRWEMDASLRTLELMASEVGATVLILKEIVLRLPRHQPLRDRISQASSPARRAQAAPGFGFGNGRDMGRLGQAVFISSQGDSICAPEVMPSSPRRGKYKGRRKHRKKEPTHEQGSYAGTMPKKMVFDQADLAAAEEASDAEGNGELDVLEDAGWQHQARGIPPDPEDESPFPLDMDDGPASPGRSGHADGDSPRGPRRGGIKDAKKRRKSAARQEQRRLDLLRGDGTNPMWAEIQRSAVDDGSFAEVHEGSSQFCAKARAGDTNAIAPVTSSTSPLPHRPTLALPHQPARPSSLRLATPAGPPQETFMDDLLHIPLDNLSLSFADVQTIPEADEGQSLDSPLSSSADEEERGSGDGTDADEMICVEALVVRKVQHDEGGVGVAGGDGSEEEWGYGGEEDVWGFGGDE
ncbi:hypothetical protein IAU60_004943 [Kwoniella sp. DSM 27419]